MEKEIKNSINYLNEKTEFDSGFSVPEGYLDGIEDDFTLKLKEDTLPKDSSFEVPNNYFDTLETKILDKTSPNKKGKVISLKRNLLKLIPVSIAASLLLFFSLQFFNTQTPKNTPINIDELSSTEIENWLDDETNIELTFTFDEDFDDIELAFSGVDIDNNAIEDYFSSIDYADLINETN